MSHKFGSFFSNAFKEWISSLRKKMGRKFMWSIVSTIPTYLIIGIWLGEKELNSAIRLLISGIGGTVIVLVIQLLYFLLNAPFALLQEQDKIIEKVEQKSNIELRVYQVENSEPHSTGFFTRFEIVSNKDVLSCYVKIKRAIKFLGKEKNKEIILKERDLLWENSVKAEKNKMNLISDYPEVFLLIRVDMQENKAYLVGYGAYYTEIKKGMHLLELAVYSMNFYTATLSIKFYYDGKTKISIKEISTPNILSPLNKNQN